MLCNLQLVNTAFVSSCMFLGSVLEDNSLESSHVNVTNFMYPYESSIAQSRLGPMSIQYPCIVVVWTAIMYRSNSNRYPDIICS